MLLWSLLLIGAGLAAGNIPDDFHSEGPVRPGAFLDPQGNPIIIAAGDVGLYPTGMYDDSIDYAKDIKFLLFTVDNPTTESAQQLYLNNITSITESNFNVTRLTKFIIHGFINTLESEMVVTTMNAFLKNGDFNVIVVDWSAIADNILYPIVVSEVPAVGKYVGKFVEFLVNNATVNASQIHLVGHSLGAHVAGFAGKQTLSVGIELARVTGLDPALPGYGLKSSETRLAKTDAAYVDCIHTCAGFLGFMSPICQSDYYPNGGMDPQPGCFFIDLGSCSHKRAFELFAASVNETNVFKSKRCDLILFGIPLACSDKEDSLMGYPSGAERSQGTYYLRTTGSFPFAEST